jgi:hypothetical protein
MKHNKLIYRIILFLLTITIGISVYYFVINQKFSHRLENIQLDIHYVNLVIPFVEYFAENNYLPLCLDSLSYGFSDSSWNKVKNIVYKDYLAKKDTLLVYYPLYNKNFKKDAFIIVSGGIDGKIDNFFYPQDTVFKDDFFNRFDFYNFTEEKLLQNYFEADTVYNKFNLFKYFFGKKDYLIYYVDCTESIYTKSKSIKEFLNNKEK